MKKYPLADRTPHDPSSNYVFLDDERNPGHLRRLNGGVWNHDASCDWWVFRTAESLIKAFQEGYFNARPLILSLDHDLGDKIKTGYDLLNYLVDQHLEGNIDISQYTVQVHSQNPIGAENIRDLWKSFQRHLQG